MKNTLKKQAGFSLMEIIVVAAILMAAVAGVLSYVNSAQETMARKKVQDDIIAISTGASDWAGGTINYTGISMTVLSADEYINSDFGDGSNKNPFGGDYIVAVGADATEYTIRINGLETSTCNKLAKKIDGATCDGSATVTVTRG